MLLRDEGCELYIEPQLQSGGGGYANGQSVAFLYDYSAHARQMTVPSDYPIFTTPALNGKAAVVWDGTKKPLKNTSTFTVRCGFMVVKVNETAFSNFAGILTDTAATGILVGDSGTNHFYDLLQANYRLEYRMSDRIYSRNLKTKIFAPPAPMNVYRIIFFRYWIPIQVTGIQIGQDRVDTARKAKMSLALLALYSTDFCEKDLRASLKILAENFALPLEDVFPFYLDKTSTHRDVQSGNVDYPPSGGMIAETLGDAKLESELRFADRKKTEIDEMRSFLLNHYLIAPFIIRSFASIPPRDYQGWAKSLLEFNEDGTIGTFGFKEN